MLKRLKPLLNSFKAGVRKPRELTPKQIEKRLGIADYGILKERTVRPPLRKGL